MNQILNKKMLVILTVLLFFIPSITLTADQVEEDPDSKKVNEYYGDENKDLKEDSSNSNEQQEEDNNGTVNEDQNNNDEQLLFQSERSLFLDFVKMIVALVAVLGLIYVLLKFIQKRSQIYQQTRSLENLGGISLGSNKSVQIIRVGDQYYLIGVGEDVQLLATIDDPQTLEDLVNSRSKSMDSQPFQKILKSFQNLNKNPYKQAETKQQIETELQSMKNTRERIMKRYQNRNDEHND
ncbi:flagellar biosynthetic protein FliO [Bacillaceae bacterium W0354]